MFFLGTALNLLLYIVSVMMFVKGKTTLGIGFLIGGIILTIIFISFYSKRKKRKKVNLQKKEEGKSEDKEKDKSSRNNLFDCEYLPLDCFDCDVPHLHLPDCDVPDCD